MPLTAGTRLGPYEIVSALGAGGMGEVYRATDSNLKRSVAIKVLPASMAGDTDRLERFQREAEVLAALNHSNIAAIYGLEKTADFTALVMELVDGEDLSAHIARTAIPLADALPIARQIADALEAAHEQGIIHRDLKPANVKVRADGTVKVLDFGLAKVMEPGAASGTGSNLANSPTMTSPAMTAMGMILGTAAYMAPEQAKGRAVDKRADIWAFGVVFYEMLTGRRAFQGDDVSDLLVAVLSKDVDLGALPAGTPPSIVALIQRCLARDPKLRLRDIGEARILLANPVEPARPAATSRTSSRPWWIIAAGAVALSGLAATAAWYAKPVSAIPFRRIPLASDTAGAPVRGLFGSRPVLSRDGASVAYVDRGHLWVRGLDAIDPHDLGAVPAGAHALTWSPDGRSLAFAAEQTLRTIPVAGGPAFVVCQIPASGTRLLGLDWSPDGQLVMAVWQGSLYSVRATGGEPAMRLAIDATKEVDFHEVAEAPSGGLIVSTHLREHTDLRVELVRGAERKILWDGAGVTRVVFAAPDMALVQRTAPNTGVWAVPWTEGHLDLGSAIQVAAGAGWFAAAEGTLVYGLAVPQPYGWAWVDRGGAISATPGVPQNLVSKSALSPDGRRMAFAARKGGKTDIFVRDLGTGGDTQLTFTKLDAIGMKANPSSLDPIDAVQSPNWFPSGDRLLYAAAGAQSTGLVSQRADSAETPQPLGPGSFGAVSRDGRVLLALVGDGGSAHLRHSVIAADGGIGPPEVVLTGAKEPDVSQFELSRDGRLLAYVTRDSGTHLLLSGFPDARGQVPVDENGRDPHFSPDGRELFYVKTSTDRTGQATESLVSVSIVSVSPAKIGLPTTIYVPKAGEPPLDEFHVAPDGRRFLMRVPVALPPGEGAKLIYVQNWRAGLKK